MINMKRILPVMTVLFLCLTHFTVAAEHWPQFRGTYSDGVAGSQFPETWNESSNILWKIPVEGEGWSCPIVWGNKVFVTSAVRTDKGKDEKLEPYRNRRRQGGGNRSELLKAEYQWELICLDAKTGKEIWKKSVRTGHPSIPRHGSNSYATETPVTDGSHIYVYFGMNGLYCYDMEGNLKWEKDTGTYEMRAGWGTSSSPVLHKDKLFLQIDNEEQSFLIAFDKKTGEEVWKKDREEPSQYSTPIVWKNSKRDELITVGQMTRSYNPENGELFWELDMEKGRSSASALAIKDRLYLGTEFRNRGRDDDGGGFLFAITPGGSGNITPENNANSGEHILWKISDSGLQMASPVLCEGYLYLFERRRGLLHCINASNGETAYRKRVPGSRAFWASPWTDGKQVYCLDDSGTTFVLAGGPEFRLLGKNVIDGQSWSSPAIANDSLYLRTVDHLYCISKAK